LPRLQLKWYINYKKLLYCKQLGSEIDPNQDAGTLYGLESVIVLRDELNENKRSLLVPAGDLKIGRRGFHVGINIIGNGTYVSFGIDQVLGRVTCAADSRVISYLTVLHAITSFAYPDPLLKRTGTEEALALLSSYCLPFEPLNRIAYENLRCIAALTPQRQWYPPDRRTLQTVSWDHRLTTTVQHEAYTHMVNRIVERSNSLAPFYRAEQIEMPVLSTTELNRRAAINRSRFYCADVVTASMKVPKDLVYEARHSLIADTALADTMKSIALWPSRLPSCADISGLLVALPNIGGFSQAFDDCGSMHNSLSADFAVQFGPMATYCKGINKESAWTLAFTLAPLAFRGGQNVDILNFWLAFALFDELKGLPSPVWSVYSHYRKETHPTVDTILPILRHAAHVSDEEERRVLTSLLNRKQVHQLQVAEGKQVADIERDLQSFAQHLLTQWPTHSLTAHGFQSSHLDLVKAMELVAPEFQRLYENLELSRYLDAVQNMLDMRTCLQGVIADALHQDQPFLADYKSTQIVPRFHQDLLSVRVDAASMPISASKLRFARQPAAGKHGSTGKTTALQSSSLIAEVNELDGILRSISEKTSTVQQKYFNDFRESLLALQQRRPQHRAAHGEITHAAIDGRVLQTKHSMQDCIVRLQQLLSRDHAQYKWLDLGGLWPRVTSVTLLEALRPTSDVRFGENVKNCITQLGLAVSEHQHALRLRDASLHKDRKKVSKELKEGCSIAYSPYEYPEWLLLEIECDLRIRADQIEVAIASIKPETGTNSVLQMNMGLGKTSVISPAIAVHLAGLKEHVMRVVVPRSLLRQTSVLLHGRLGRLLGSGVLHIPYSRQIDHSISTTEEFLRLHQNAMRDGTVILAAPEHILSFKVRVHLANQECIDD
jgi:hypothetical protein